MHAKLIFDSLINTFNNMGYKITTKDARKVRDAFLSSIMNIAMSGDERLTIRHLGVFYKSRGKMRFKPAAVFKDRLNNGFKSGPYPCLSKQVIDIMEAILSEYRWTREVHESIYRSMFTLIETELAVTGKIRFTGWGTFYTADVAPRHYVTAKDPTGHVFKPRHMTVRFKPSTVPSKNLLNLH